MRGVAFMLLVAILMIPFLAFMNQELGAENLALRNENLALQQEIEQLKAHPGPAQGQKVLAQTGSLTCEAALQHQNAETMKYYTLAQQNANEAAYWKARYEDEAAKNQALGIQPAVPAGGSGGAPLDPPSDPVAPDNSGDNWFSFTNPNREADVPTAPFELDTRKGGWHSVTDPDSQVEPPPSKDTVSEPSAVDPQGAGPTSKSRGFYLPKTSARVDGRWLFLLAPVVIAFIAFATHAARRNTVDFMITLDRRQLQNFEAWRRRDYE